ncbi:MAG: ferrous iron transport protein B [Roseburia sp.]|nr:ferrous iron transport protein B [Roseburia sp.]MCM1236319.1 ferrous iron transport protein B [Ruminococcus flavefaciens]
MGEIMTIALLGQPNSGKSTFYNALTGSHQHVGNWPGKTVERNSGTFQYKGNTYQVTDLPGTYSLAANSEEEIVTRDYIAGGEADLICILTDASQLERSLFMLADYAGIRVPAVILLNMMDVAKAQGKKIDVPAIEKSLGIPVLPFVASEKKDYAAFYELLERSGKEDWILDVKSLSGLYEAEFGTAYQNVMALLPEGGISVYENSWIFAKLAEHDAVVESVVEDSVGGEVFSAIKKEISGIKNGASHTGNCKFKWIDGILSGNVSRGKGQNQLGKFDRFAVSKRGGKRLAAGVILLGLMASMVLAAPVMYLGSVLPLLANPVSEWLLSVGTAPILVSLLCDGIWTAFSFTVMMCGFVFGTTFVFGFLEEIGYMARISYVFDGTMRRLGLHGKAVMPFLVSFGCNIAGATGARVLDTWGQRMAAISMSWVVPCGSTWAVVGLVSSVFFGPGAALIVFLLFVVSVLHLQLTAHVFGKRFLKESDRTGLIMELPPYHKPRWGSLFCSSVGKMAAAFRRAINIVTVVLLIMWALSYNADGNLSGSILYRIGNMIEPVTMWFGLRWQTFIAWLASMMGKEGALGVLGAVLGNGNGNLLHSLAMQKVETADSVSVTAGLMATLTKPEALAFIFAYYFNMPCLMTMSATAHETRSLKWTLRVAGYYIAVSLLLAGIVYHIGCLIF